MFSDHSEIKLEVKKEKQQENLQMWKMKQNKTKLFLLAHGTKRKSQRK
jgi:hypothetical protein